MSAATKAVNTVKAAGGPVRQMQYTVKTGKTIFSGTMAAVGADGYAVPAGDTAGLQVVGVATATALEGEAVNVQAGDFWIPIASGSPMSIGSSLRAKAFVKTDIEVGVAADVSNSILAGIAYDFDASGKARVSVGEGYKA